MGGDVRRRDVGARTEIDHRDALAARRARALAAEVGVVDGAVVVDEQLLVRRPSGRRRRLSLDAVAADGRGSERRRRVGETEREDVRLETARKGNPVEAGLTRRILREPPGVDRVDVGGELRRQLGAALAAVRRVRVDHVDRAAGERGRAVLRRRRAAPGRRVCRAGTHGQPCCTGNHECHGGGQASHRAPRRSLPENRGSLPASRRRMLWRCSARTPRAAIAANPTTGHGASKARQARGSAHRGDDRRERRVAERGEHDEPHDQARGCGERREREGDAARGRHHLAALREPQEDRPRVPHHRGSAGEDSDPVAAHLQSDERRNEPFGDVEERHRNAERGAVRAPHVRRADVAAPVTTDVVAAEEPREHVAERDRAEEVAAEDDQDVGGHHRPLRVRTGSSRTRSIRSPPASRGSRRTRRRTRRGRSGSRGSTRARRRRARRAGVAFQTGNVFCASPR